MGTVKERFIQMSKNFLKLFSKTSNNGTQLLHPSYPTVFISSVVYAEINSNLDPPKTTVSSVLNKIFN